eukprot:m.136058 g.136058  ORF g.136058 m.136058 type:complete len:307 (+) comp20181_c2_seq2:154-1074(+)
MFFARTDSFLSNAFSFQSDFNLVINNCCKFNPESHPYHKEAKKLQKSCAKLLQRARTNFKKELAKHGLNENWGTVRDVGTRRLTIGYNNEVSAVTLDAIKAVAAQARARLVNTRPNLSVGYLDEKDGVSREYVVMIGTKNLEDESKHIERGQHLPLVDPIMKTSLSECTLDVETRLSAHPAFNLSYQPRTELKDVSEDVRFRCYADQAGQEYVESLERFSSAFGDQAEDVRQFLQQRINHVTMGQLTETPEPPPSLDRLLHEEFVLQRQAEIQGKIFRLGLLRTVFVCVWLTLPPMMQTFTRKGLH